MEELRKPLFFIALALMVAIVLTEVGSLGLVKVDTPEPGKLEEVLENDPEVKEAFDKLDDEDKERLQTLGVDREPPGRGILYLALIDAILLFTVGLMGASLVIPHRIHGRIQGGITLIFAIALILIAIFAIMVAIAAVVLMVSLLLAVPFGTMAYMARYGFFARPTASVVLSLLMLLKLGFAGTLMLAHQRFIQNTGLVLLILTSLIGNVIVSFLHGFVPRFLVSITDGIAAIILGILAVFWALWLLFASLPAILKALRFDRV